jgi:hypothetical protein
MSPFVPAFPFHFSLNPKVKILTKKKKLKTLFILCHYTKTIALQKVYQTPIIP